MLFTFQLLFLNPLLHRTKNSSPVLFAIIKQAREKSPGSAESQTVTLPRHQEEEAIDKPNKRKSNKRTKSTTASSLFPKRGNRNVKRTVKHKNKITQGKA